MTTPSYVTYTWNIPLCFNSREFITNFIFSSWPLCCFKVTLSDAMSSDMYIYIYTHVYVCQHYTNNTSRGHKIFFSVFCLHELLYGYYKWCNICTHTIHLGLDKMAAILQTGCLNALSLKIFFVFWSKFHWSVFLGIQLMKTHHLFGLMV